MNPTPRAAPHVLEWKLMAVSLALLVAAVWNLARQPNPSGHRGSGSLKAQKVSDASGYGRDNGNRRAGAGVTETAHDISLPNISPPDSTKVAFEEEK